MSLPIAKILKSNFDNAEISYLVRENFTEIFKSIPYVDRVYSYKNKLSLLRNYRKFKKFNAVIFVMEKDLTRLKIFSFLKSTIRVGFSISKRVQNYLTDVVKGNEKFEGMENLFSKLLKPFGIKNLNNHTIPEIIPLEEDLKNFEFILPQNMKKIIIHTDTYASSRKWPYFNELIPKILEEINKKILIILTGKKKDDLEIISENILDFRGKTTLSQLSALFKSVHLVIGCDTGVMHLSRAVGAKTIVIYGPEDPQISVPSSNLIKIYPEIELDCKNKTDYFGISFSNIKRCKLESCYSKECLKTISPEMILEIVKKSLS